jgi:Family of unknown function (DUF6176)
MQAQCVRIPIVNGKTQRFVDWMAEVNGRRAEMLASMRLEGVRAEAMFLERSTAGDALVFYMQAEDLERAQQVFAASTSAIDSLTRAIIDECWDVSRATRLEVLLELLGPAHQ